MDNTCLFCKIVMGQIPSKKIYEDEEIIAFHDIRPAAPIHVLMIPKIHVANLYDCTPTHAALLAKVVLLSPKVAAIAGANNGFRFVINNGADSRQEVYHLHAHILAGAHPWERQT